MISRCLPVVGLLALGVCEVVGARAGQAGDLLIAAPAGPLAKATDAAFVQPFAQASHQPATVVALAGAETAPPTPADVALVDGQTLLAGCGGAFQKVPWSAIGGRDHMLPQAASECGVGAMLRGLVLAWSRDKFSGAPTWADFWDVAKVPGKRGLRRGARGNLEFALIADGAAPGDVYGVLRTDGGVERAFRKLDQLKPYIVWWSKDDEAPRLLASGEVLMTSALADGVLAAAKATSGVAPRDFAVQWSGALLMFESWALLTGSAGGEASQHYLMFVSDPKQQKPLGAFGGMGSAVSGGTDDLGPAEKAASPSTPANLAAGLLVDEPFWRDNGAKLDKLYEGWLAKP